MSVTEERREGGERVGQTCRDMIAVLSNERTATGGGPDVCVCVSLTQREEEWERAKHVEG